MLGRRQITNVEQLREAVYQAGLKRIRPCVMTTITTLAALIPVMISTGRGADVARAMALPVFGGMLVEPFTSFDRRRAAARITGGCKSGQALTGGAMLLTGSLIFMGCTFAGGYAAAYFVRRQWDD